MKTYIERQISGKIAQYRSIFPVVTVLGPRQCGKSTLIKKLTAQWENALYVDLQDPEDMNKLEDPGLFFRNNIDKIICLDEIQLMPHLFSVLRSWVDKDRQNGKFVLLGSASRDLVQKSSETLAGRVGYIHLSPFTFNELMNQPGFSYRKFWHRGGFPESYLSDSDENSAIWRESFIQTFIERDIPQLGHQIPAMQLRRFLTMCAHIQGQLLNLSTLAKSLSVTHPTIKRYVDLLEQTFIVRTVMPYEANIKKRLVKTPKIYIRDSGLLHQLLRINSFNELLGHPVYGGSWEGMVVENVLVNHSDWNYYFFRTSTGDELDLLLEKGNQLIAIECKASTAPKPGKGFWRALEMVRPEHTYIIAPIEGTPYALKENVTVCNPVDFLLED